MRIICLITLLLAGLVAWYQRRMLRFRRFTTSSDASVNYRRVMDAIHKKKWQLSSDDADSRIVAAAPSAATKGARVEVRFLGNDVYVNSIYDPTARTGGTPDIGGENAENVRCIRDALADI